MKKSLPAYSLSSLFRLTSLINLLLATAIAYNVLAIAGFSFACAGQKVSLLASSTIVPAADGSAVIRSASCQSNLTTGKSWQRVRMLVTAYCPCRKCCGNWADGKTASGHEILPGDCFVAADKTLAFDTEIIVPGYNENRPVKVLDRGKKITHNRLDVFLPTHEQAKNWGVKHVDALVKS